MCRRQFSCLHSSLAPSSLRKYYSFDLADMHPCLVQSSVEGLDLFCQYGPKVRQGPMETRRESLELLTKICHFV